MEDAEQRKPKVWMALDDVEEWPEELLGCLVETSEATGIAARMVRLSLAGELFQADGFLTRGFAGLKICEHGFTVVSADAGTSERMRSSKNWQEVLHY